MNFPSTISRRRLFSIEEKRFKYAEKLADEVLRAEFKTEGKTTNKNEFVTAGGVSLKEIDFKTMMAKKIPHLYFAGEVLNIDGITGGFNFQSAWSTSAVAAKAAITLENGSGSD
jgi:predicted flavoprotein YhiN